MKIERVILLLMLLSHAAAVRVDSWTIAEPRTVALRSGRLHLRALLWQPDGRGPCPAILFSHGSGPTDPSRAQIIGPAFARHGYVFLYLFRRGDGLSASQATFTGELLERERIACGVKAARVGECGKPHKIEVPRNRAHHPNKLQLDVVVKIITLK